MEIKPVLYVALVQANTKYTSVSANLAHLEELLETVSSDVDIFLLPELFNTGYQLAFTTPPEVMGLETTRWMLQMAKRKNAALCGSIAIKENDQVFNRMIFATPDGKTQTYDKVNVFRFSGEDKVFSAGLRPAIFEFRGWRLKAIICFDLRFPESVRNTQPWYDAILCSAHWPKPRIEAWDKLVMGRAIENQAYLAAVNRFGQEGDAIYPGHSTAIDFAGQSLVQLQDKEQIGIVSFEYSALHHFRNRFPFLEK